MKKYFYINKFIFISIIVIFSFVQYNNSFGSNLFGSENESIFFNIQDDFDSNLSDKKIDKSKSLIINQPPIANAGLDQGYTLVYPNTTLLVTLDGSASFDPDGIIESYIWRESGQEIAQGVKPSVALGVGIHNIKLYVTDDDNLESDDEIIITINVISNEIPIANAGFDKSEIMNYPDTAIPVILDGSSSFDPDGSIVSYVWIKDGIEIATGKITTAMLEVGVNLITLTVTDNYGITDTDDVLIVLYYKPVARAGLDQEHTLVYPNTTIPVTLNGYTSFDPDGRIKIYIWKKGNIEIARGVNPTIILEEGVHNITLFVIDNNDLESSDDVVITIKPFTGLTYTVSGVVMVDNQGMVGVHIIDDVYTDLEGRYSFSKSEGSTAIVIPQKNGFVFIPEQRTYNLGVELTELEYPNQDYKSKQINYNL